MTKYLSDFERNGFKADEIIPFLAKHGINIGTLSDMPELVSTKAEASFPEWKRTMSLLPFLTHTEAASALADIDTDVPHYLSDYEGVELSKWGVVISRSILAGELIADETDRNRDGVATAWRIKPTDLMEWCGMKDIPYPLPGGHAFHQTDTGLREALAESESERAQLKAKVAAHEAAVDQRANLQAEIYRLRDELRDKEEKLAVITSDRDTLKADAAVGKSKTTLLKIIGGMAIDGYGMDIHAQQLKGIGDMVESLQLAGADVTEKTLRERIQEAASIIEKPKSKT